MPYQLQAAIIACHVDAPSFAQTDWAQILVLYDMLHAALPSPVVRLNRAVALRYVAGIEAALAEVDAVAPALRRYHLLHAIRGALLLELGEEEKARAAQLRALHLTANTAEEALLRRRIHPS
ncbi:MAG: hypothetical protein ACM3ML_32815 [Micromonosporaceae bacterium]